MEQMATGVARDGLIRGFFDACISGADAGIQRRPYHKNCSCALHKSRGQCSHSTSRNNVSYPIRRTWSEGSFTLMAASSSAAAYVSPGSSPATNSIADVAGKTERRIYFLITKNNEVISVLLQPGEFCFFVGH
ncbi:uncharacterized protein LOC124943118 [Impatiens glandulifera]|uniref:uncharacterized protein LOC124943118 n=1 Tax=Impatiens glandulifera TaxID=253017 RepID=UPI001FB184D3|nr:uncharacterized protein LOC124943118 [Impatiens glandulifera]